MLRPAPFGIIASAVLLAACAAGTQGSPSGAVDPTPSSPASHASPASHDPSSTIVCSNPHGGQCLGELAGGTYTTVVFETPLTYTVSAGWTNDEDLPGNFIVLPPTASRAEIDAGTADYVGVYDGVAVANGDCAEQAQYGVVGTPAAMAEWYVAHEGLETTQATPVTVGGLDGVVVDLAIAEGYTDGCPFEGYEGIPMVPMFIGAGLASVHHVALGESVTRLYLLEGLDGRVLAIEVSDVPGGADLEELDAIVDLFEFSVEP